MQPVAVRTALPSLPVEGGTSTRTVPLARRDRSTRRSIQLPPQSNVLSETLAHRQLQQQAGLIHSR